ncbi:MAG: DNA translocase FtsK 4TM domain-containing protein [Anaerovoracaceae bacterium]|jgi:S-DNA-T family DNA segregation ATPase FtsK/SpoIIIE
MTEKKRRPGRPPGSKNKKTAAPKTEHRVKDEIAAIIILALGVFMVIAVQTKFAGAVGQGVGLFLKGLFGFGAYFLPYILIFYAVLMFTKVTSKFRLKTVLLVTVLFLMIDLINAGRYVEGMQYGILGIGEVYDQGGELLNGGVFGMYVGSGIYKLIGLPGLYIFAVVIALICLLLLFNTPMAKFFEKAKERKAAIRDRKAEAKAAIMEQEKAKAKEEAELAKKREAVQAAGRQVEMDYTPPSKRAEELAQIKPIPSDKIRPKLNAKEWKKLPENKKKILDLMQDDTIFEDRDKSGGYGLDGSEPSSITQPELPTEPVAEPEPEFDGFIKRTPEETAAAHGHVAIGGASVATAKSETEKEDTEVTVSPAKRGRYRKPPVDLLNAASKEPTKTGMRENLSERATLLETTLQSFGVDANVVNVISGPSVTRYEIEPARGVKVQSITRLADDIALNMRARSIRIEAPIPGKAAVGIEIENESRQMVSLREIIGSTAFRDHKSKLAFTVGRDIGGNAVVADLGKMPHMLIAGATGSGKSVCINTIIASILYKARPEEVKLVLIDPKMVELGNYNGIPHLLIPVVTDSTKAASALQWAVAEMTDRYKKFASRGVRDIGAYNSLMKKEGEKEEILPQIVIIIDELADLMMVASSQVEDAICRLAQLARAAGMHLILATQRPSVDVITGLIKANIPSRIAFMVSSQIDSRTIIDMAGAEKLVGNGDMLFKPQDLNKPKRIQGPFVSDEEVERLIAFVKEQGEEPDYNEAVMERIEKGNSYDGNEEEDELLPDAIETVISAGQASVSMIQRRFRVGYNRAARIIDMMEARGIIGPQDGSRPRQVLISEDRWEEMKNEGFS